jgi:hypothetical protein
MVDMRVTQNDRIYLLGRYRKRLAVASFVCAAALNQTTLKQHIMTIRANQVQRSGYLFRSAEERQIKCHRFRLSPALAEV